MEFDYLESSQLFDKTFWKHSKMDDYNFDHPNMLYYWNFIMANEGTVHSRKRYYLMDIIGEVGGFLSAIEIIVVIIFGIYNYKLHETIVYQVYLEMNDETIDSKRY